MSYLAAQFLTGLASASSLFLVASGLSIIFGVTRIVNFAHGSLYMLGAYLAYSLTARLMPAFGGVGFWLSLPLAALLVGLLGAVIEVLVLRRLYRAPPLFQLVATFALVLIVQDAALAIWGPQDLLGPRAPGLEGALRLAGARLPLYDLFLIALGPAVLGLLWLLFHRSRWGILVRAATEDREMVAALGIDQRLLFTGVLFLGAALAGLGGALQLPRQAASLGMDLNIIAEVFVVVVVGGMGSLPGAYLAAVLIGELGAFGILIFPEITLVLLFLVMAAVLALRPQGLLGRPEAEQEHKVDGAAGLRPATPRGQAALAFLLLLLFALPLIAGDFTLGLMSEVLIFALFAASLQLMMGFGGMISFGHAAFFGFGAYAAALLVQHLGWAMAPAVLAAPLAAGLAALAFGWLCVRLSGVYLAMLTLAISQILWSIAFQWVPVTGGDNGILGVWPSPWASDATTFYYLTLTLAVLALLALRRLLFSPFGYALRALRDQPRRAEASGLAPQAQRWRAFALAGAFAGLAGGLYAFLKGSVFPAVLSIPTSIDALVILLLGGLEALLGPLVGALLLVGLKAELAAATDLWRGIIGAIVLALAILAPSGLAGLLDSLRARWDETRRRSAA
ncbi:MAG: ABC transporter permease [Kiloniellales bacterium]